MGAWGYEPYANDSACDFFFVAFRDSNFADHIEKALKSDDEPEVRAAAFLLEKIGYGYIYPHEKREEHINLAIEKLRYWLEHAQEEYGWKEPERYETVVKRQIDNLLIRLNREDENVLMSRIRKDHLGAPADNVYEVLEWAMSQIGDKFADHSETDLPHEFRLAKAILEQRAQNSPG